MEDWERILRDYPNTGDWIMAGYGCGPNPPDNREIERIHKRDEAREKAARAEQAKLENQPKLAAIRKSFWNKILTVIRRIYDT